MTTNADLHSVLMKCINHFKQHSTSSERNDMVELLACWLFSVHTDYYVPPVDGNVRLVSTFKDLFRVWDDE